MSCLVALAYLVARLLPSSRSLALKAATVLSGGLGILKGEGCRCLATRTSRCLGSVSHIVFS